MPDGMGMETDANVIANDIPKAPREVRKTAEGIPMTDTLVKEVREVAEESGAPLLIGN